MMTYKTALLIILVWLPCCSADVWTSVYYADGITPLALRDPNILDVYVDIMVGTQLSVVVSSDTNTAFWSGRLDIQTPYDAVGRLWPCDYNELTYNWQDSCSTLPDAQSLYAPFDVTGVMFSDHGSGHYIDMYGADEPNTGDWFAFDYHAVGLGECRIIFTEDLAQSSEGPDPIPGGIPPVTRFVNEGVFTHVQTRDFNEDHVVDFRDFALMTIPRQDSDPHDPNMPVDSTDFPYEYDFDQNQTIDMADLSMFMDFWLERTK